MRYGGYLLFQTSDKTDSYIQLGIGTETSSTEAKSNLIYSGRFVFGKIFIDAKYSNKYPYDGKNIYTLDKESEGGSYLEIKAGVVFNLAK